MIFDGTVVCVRLDKKAESTSVHVALGVRANSDKLLLAFKNMDGESEAASRAPLDHLVKRRLATPEQIIVGGTPELDQALFSRWSHVPEMRQQFQRALRLDTY